MLWPDTATRTQDGSLSIGGVSLPAIADEFGTPVYIYDAATLRGQARRFQDAFRSVYPKARVVYAGKAYLSPAIVRLLHEEGLGLDVVSGGELAVGLKAGVTPDAITFHGNNKSEAELREAIAAGVGLIVVDYLEEFDLVSKLAQEAGREVACLLRVNPGIDTHTHEKIRTGHLDSKFGVPIATGQAAEAVERAVQLPGISLRGYHAHIGSQLFEADAYQLAVATLMAFAAEMRDRFGVIPEVISPGGGFGIAYGSDQEEADIRGWATAAAEAVRSGCQEYDLPEPELVVEPGRAIVGRAGVALYRVGAIKRIPDVRTYVSVDGGMADNIRPTLYGARYEAALANRPEDGPSETVTIAGKYCESGDILIHDITLPRLCSNDLLAIPAAGAYSLAMASNYNMALRPPVVLVESGAARLIRRRETYEDLVKTEQF